mmetsp:Transcript_30196/g.86196  ORF Transcript_30196/g.86196 Transcript_30196/m.86196 type:complete len:203 (+) Transcript_30196:1167-1775(+)
MVCQADIVTAPVAPLRRPRALQDGCPPGPVDAVPHVAAERLDRRGESRALARRARQPRVGAVQLQPCLLIEVRHERHVGILAVRREDRHHRADDDLHAPDREIGLLRDRRQHPDLPPLQHLFPNSCALCQDPRRPALHERGAVGVEAGATHRAARRNGNSGAQEHPAEAEALPAPPSRRRGDAGRGRRQHGSGFDGWFNCVV